MEQIPEARREAVEMALRSAFGRRRAQDFRPVGGGASGALIHRFEVGGRRYLLRIEPERIRMDDRRRGYDCMAAAAAVGAAPATHYVDPAAGVAILDFIAARPLAHHPGGRLGLAEALGGLVARVQAIPPFPSLGLYPEVIGMILANVAASGLLAPGLLEPHAEGLARIRRGLPWPAVSLVSAHNDPNPRNLLFDGERLWLVDWELAARNDPLVDLAILTTEFAETPELEDVLVRAALGRAPNRALSARLGVVRLLTRLFYGCIVLDSLLDAPRSRPDPSLAAYSPAGFRAAVAAGDLRSGAPETVYAFAKMSLAAFLDGLAAPGFDEMLRLASEAAWPPP